MKKLSSLILIIFIAGCASKPTPVVEKDAAQKIHSQTTNQTTVTKTTKTKTTKKEITKKKTTKKRTVKKKHSVVQKKRPKKTTKKKVTKKPIKKPIKKKTEKKKPLKKPEPEEDGVEDEEDDEEDTEEEKSEKKSEPELITKKTVSLSVEGINQLMTCKNRHIFFVGKKVKPLKKQLTEVFNIEKGQSKDLKELKELFQQEVERDSTFITVTTLGELFKDKPLINTLNSIENLGTKKSFFIVFYNYEKNLLELLDTKLLNGLKNVLLFMPLSNKTGIKNEKSVLKLTKSLKTNSVTFRQMHEIICDNNIKECSSHMLGNDYLLY